MIIAILYNCSLCRTLDVGLLRAVSIRAHTVEPFTIITDPSTEGNLYLKDTDSGNDLNHYSASAFDLNLPQEDSHQ